MYSTFNRKKFDSLLEPCFFGENVNIAPYDSHCVFLISFFVAILAHRSSNKSPNRKVTIRELLLNERKRIRAPPKFRKSQRPCSHYYLTF